MAITVDFTGSSGTSLPTHDANITAGVNSLSHSQLDGSGYWEMTNVFQENDWYYADGALDGDSNSKVILIGSWSWQSGSKGGPIVRASGAQEGYAAYIDVVSGNFISQIRFTRNGAALGSRVNVTSSTYDFTSATQIEFDMVYNNATDQLDLTVTQGGNTETISSATDGTPLTGGQPGAILAPANGSSGLKIAEWSTTDGGGGGGSTPIKAGIAQGVGLVGRTPLVI